MGNVRSARGEMINFDLLRIKEKLAARPATNDIRAREDFIERKIHRRVRKTYPKAGQVAPISVEPNLPGTEDAKVEVAPVIAPAVQETVDAPATKQVARPKK